jgi:hypothetical protein
VMMTVEVMTVEVMTVEVMTVEVMTVEVMTVEVTMTVLYDARGPTMVAMTVVMMEGCKGQTQIRFGEQTHLGHDQDD